MLAGVAWATYVSATMIPSDTVALGARERNQLAVPSLLGKVGKLELIDAQRFQTTPPSLMARITCDSFRNYRRLSCIEDG